MRRWRVAVLALGAVLATVVVAGAIAGPGPSGTTAGGPPPTRGPGATSGPPVTVGSGPAQPAPALPAPVPPVRASAGSLSAASAGAAGSSASPGSGGAPAGAALPANLLAGTKVVETASLSLGVGHGRLDGILTRLDGVVTGAGGYVARSDTVTQNGVPSAYLTLRIPEGAFAATLDRVKALGRVSDLSTSGQDVTSQYVDLQARIAALQASRQQYLTILSRASTVGDVLAVQAQIDNIQSQLEQLQGQLAVLADQTAYGTLSASLTEAAAPGAPRPRPAGGLARAWHQATARFAHGIEWMVAALGPLGLVVLLLAGGWGAYRLAGRLIGRRPTPDAALPAA